MLRRRSSVSSIIDRRDSLLHSIGRCGLALVTGVTLIVLANGCRSKPPDMSEVFTTRTLALGYLQRAQLPEAEAQFKKLIQLVPDDPLGYADLGLTYLQGGRYRDAEAQLDRARKLDPANP